MARDHLGLKTWKVTKFKLYSGEETTHFNWILRVECPHCGNATLVTKEWRKPREQWRYPSIKGATKNYVGRACTYCFRTSKISE